MRGQKLSDNKPISGKNRLTDSAIDHLQDCYGLAIRQNLENVEAMRKAVWALYFHTLSSNDNPNYGLCPAGPESWCKYNSGLVTGKKYNHPHSLPPAVMEVIKPVFRDLADPNLLKKCMHGRTQNPNECVNSVIWNRIPKTVFVGIKTLHFGVFDAVNNFNNGNITECRVLENLGLSAGCQTVEAMLRPDKERLRNAEHKFQNLSKEARQQKRAAKRRLLDQYEDEEDEPSYGAGLY